MPEPWNIFHEELVTGNGTNLRKKHISVIMARQGTIQAFDKGCGDTGLGVCPAELQSGLVFPHCIPTPLLWNCNVYYVALFVETKIFFKWNTIRRLT